MEAIDYVVFSPAENLYKRRRDAFEKWLGPYIDPWVPGWVTPNGLSFFRIVMAVPVCYLLFQMRAVYGGLFLYLVACATDLLDGPLARRRKKVTKLGKILDPIADKVLHVSLFVFFLRCLVLTIFTQSAIVIIIAADILTFILGAVVLFFIRGIEVESNYLGKIKFVSQCAGATCLIMGWTNLIFIALPIAAVMGVLSARSYLLAVVYR